jgi:hypothetical protein
MTARGIALVALLAACDDAGGGAPADAGPSFAADRHRWAPLADTASDPFRPDGGVPPACDPESFYVDDSQADFEVNTAVCHFLTVEQPLPVALPAGEHLRVRVWHGRLWSADPGPVTGLVGLAVGDRVVWSETVPIPALGGLVDGDWEIDRDLPAGTPLRYHVQNHGDNRWSLLEVRGGP